MKEHNVTSEPQTAFISTASEITADSASKPMPLDRSSEEWRSQFGALPSFCGQSNTLRSARGHVRHTATGTGTGTGGVDNPTTTNRFTFLVALMGIALVGGLIVYGYFPPQQAVVQKRGEKSVVRAAAAQGKKQPRPAGIVARASAIPDTVSAAVSLSKLPAKKAVKQEGTSAREPRGTVQTSPSHQPAPDRTAKARKPKTTVPVPAREPLKKAAIKIPAAAVSPAASLTAAQARPMPAAQPLPKAAPPPLKSKEPEGINPLGLPL